MGITSAAKKLAGSSLGRLGSVCSAISAAQLVRDAAGLGPKLAACAKELKNGTRRPTPSLIAPLLAAALLAVYAASPVDLIADFIPFLGFLDDLALCGIAVELAKSALEKAEGVKREGITEKLNEALEKLRAMRPDAAPAPEEQAE